VTELNKKPELDPLPNANKPKLQTPPFGHPSAPIIAEVAPSIRYPSDIAAGVLEREIPEFVSFNQACKCYIYGKEPRFESDLDYLSVPAIPPEYTPAQLEFVAACQDKRLIVGGRLCSIRIPLELMQHTPKVTRNALRALDYSQLNITNVVGGMQLKPHHFQIDGILWEHNLIVQYFWDGSYTDDHIPFLRKTTRSWNDRGRNYAEFVAFCDVEVDVRRLRDLLYDPEPHKHDLAKAIVKQRSQEDGFVQPTPELKDPVKLQIGPKAGRPKKYDMEAMFRWLVAERHSSFFSKNQELIGELAKHFGEANTPHPDLFAKFMRQTEERKNWMKKHVKTFA